MPSTTLINPATGVEFTTVPQSSLAEVDDAITHAASAQRAWAALAPAARAGALRDFAGVVGSHIDELAALEVLNSGHPIGQARWEAGHVRDVLTYYSAAPERMIGKQIPVAGGLDVTFLEPLGVVGVIVPWNFPMTIASWGFAPALAAGNAVVLKPAEWTPLTAIRLGELAIESGLPDGLFQVLPGKGAVVGNRFVTHEAVRKIVFADSDLEKAAATAPSSVFENAGQDCCARSRILVERNAYDRFMERLEPAVKAFSVGDPNDEATDMGPLVSKTHFDSVNSYLTDDSNVAFRGTAPTGPGYWLAPTVLTPTSRTDRVVTDEIFGPVVSVLPFEDEADAIALANASIYGLSGSIFTRDIGRAIRVARGVESGNLSVNSHASVRYTTPFGGFKHSGLGRELGPDAAAAFTETKNVFISTD